MRLLFSLQCADPGIFVRGGEGGPTAEKKRNNNIFNPQLILQFYRVGGGSNIFQGAPTFSRGGGGGPDAYFY